MSLTPIGKTAERFPKLRVILTELKKRRKDSCKEKLIM